MMSATGEQGARGPTTSRGATTGAGAEALEELYREGFESFLRVATAICGDPDLGRDAVQEGFARALAGRSAFRRQGPLGAWVWRVVVNSARNTAARRPPTHELDEAAVAAPEPERDRVRDARVRRAVAALPERQRLVLFLRYYADLEYAAIGRIVGIRTGTVSATLHAAHASLRASLSELT
jgi:RNA polymerase sigma-70 factor (ECF subfamily)